MQNEDNITPINNAVIKKIYAIIKQIKDLENK